MRVIVCFPVGGGWGTQKLTAAEQEKEFARLMLSNKKRHLYDKMQHGIKKHTAVADNLRAKRDALAAPAAPPAAGKKRKAAK